MQVEVFSNDLATEVQTNDLFDQIASQMSKSSGRLHSIWLTSGILEDNLFKSLEVANFERVFDSKALPALNVDCIARKRKLDRCLFVGFSSYSCGFGNAGQTNYGYANSVLDELIARRKAQGMPCK